MARQKKVRPNIDHFFDQGAEEIFEKALEKQLNDTVALRTSKQVRLLLLLLLLLMLVD
jgi:hypothetical protein